MKLFGIFLSFNNELWNFAKVDLDDAKKVIDYFSIKFSNFAIEYH